MGKPPDTPDTRDILVASSPACRERRRGCHDDAIRGRGIDPYGTGGTCPPNIYERGIHGNVTLLGDLSGV